MILILSIIPLLVEGEYRYQQNPITGQLTNEPNNEIWKADAACMAVPWLFGIGFVITFSALFAKIWRMCKIMDEDEDEEGSTRRVIVSRNLSIIILFFLSFEISL